MPSPFNPRYSKFYEEDMQQELNDLNEGISLCQTTHLSMSQQKGLAGSVSRSVLGASHASPRFMQELNDLGVEKMRSSRPARSQTPFGDVASSSCKNAQSDSLLNKNASVRNTLRSLNQWIRSKEEFTHRVPPKLSEGKASPLATESQKVVRALHNVSVGLSSHNTKKFSLAQSPGSAKVFTPCYYSMKPQNQHRYRGELSKSRLSQSSKLSQSSQTSVTSHSMFKRYDERGKRMSKGKRKCERQTERKGGDGTGKR